jgi:hypothetical protein
MGRPGRGGVTTLIYRYWLFAGDEYYPGGGARDFVSSHFDLGSAEKAGAQEMEKRGSLSWAHIWDVEAQAIVWTAPMRSSVRFPLTVAALCAIAIILTKCPGPIPPGWDKDSPLNQPHPPRR